MLKLSDFDMNEVTGFLPQNSPDTSAAAGNAAWHDLAINLPKYWGTGNLKKWVEKLPPFEHVGNDKQTLERDMRALSYIGHAYLWCDAEVPQTIPAILSKPWATVAAKLERFPILSYPSYCLYNYRSFDSNQMPFIGNVAIIQNFLGGIDEDWFILIHVDIEAKAGKAMRAIPQLLVDAENNNIEGIVAGLNQVSESLQDMNAALNRMGEFCDPFIYYTRVRPYIFGTKNNPALPNGLIYEGCFDNKPQFYRGETGAQSGIVPTIDGLLGVHHEDDPLKEYLLEMRLYMPAPHRKFLETVEKQSKVRAVCEANKNHKGLIDAYNTCFDELYAFRHKHLEYAASYIHKQALQINNSTAVGTGGTPFMTYLAKHRDETRIVFSVK